MSEKLRPNFTPVPNVIFDDAMKTLQPGAVKVLLGICRYTYGWGKTEGDRISLKQLQEITGMARGSVARSLKELGSLVTITPGDPRKQLASKYRINVAIPDTELVSLCDQGPVSKRDQASLLASRIKRPSKESPKKEKYRRAKSAALPDPAVNQFKEFWASQYRNRFKVEYHFEHGKDGSHVKALLGSFDITTLKEKTEKFFLGDDEWTQTKGGFTIGVFRSQINRLNSTGAKLGAVPSRGLQEIPLL